MEPAIEVWCRLESQAGRVRRVHVTHPSGEILVSYPPEKFESALIRRMELGQIRGRLEQSPADVGSLLVLRDGTGRVVFEERIVLPTDQPSRRPPPV
jgi:hypothetical protein